jgi:hypothetical protein
MRHKSQLQANLHVQQLFALKRVGQVAVCEQKVLGDVRQLVQLCTAPWSMRARRWFMVA